MQRNTIATQNALFQTLSIEITNQPDDHVEKAKRSVMKVT